MLNESHPAYLTQLRVSLVKAREHADMIILLISMISIGILCLQIPIGMLQLPPFVFPSLPSIFRRFILIKYQASEKQCQSPRPLQFLRDGHPLFAWDRDCLYFYRTVLVDSSETCPIKAYLVVT